MASFRYKSCVTIVGAASIDQIELENILRSSPEFPNIAFRRESRVENVSFPPEVIHAIVFTPTAYSKVTPQDIKVIEATTKLGTSRVYLALQSGWTKPQSSPLDDFIQKASSNSASEIAEQILSFFREASSLNRRHTVLHLRDSFSIKCYNFLKFFWPISYVFAGLHIINAILILALHNFSFSRFLEQYTPLVSTFLGLFFAVHFLTSLLRNFLFGLRIGKSFSLGFLIPAIFLGLASALVIYSVFNVDKSGVQILVCAAIAITTYSLYMKVRDIRAECTSLSGLQQGLANPERRIELVNSIKSWRIGHGAFPLFSHRRKSIFISYMHGSKWSSDTATLIHNWTSGSGFEVFFDSSSIPSGALWRQHLLRGISECGYFIAVLDGKAPITEWVLAESAYAAILRKSIGKPRILLIFMDIEKILKDEQNPIRSIYLDIFSTSPAQLLGAAVIEINSGNLIHLTPKTLEMILKQIKPMCLLN